MTANGRKQTLVSLEFDWPERLLSVKADFQNLALEN